MTSDQKKLVLLSIVLGLLVVVYIAGAALGVTRDAGSESGGCQPLPNDATARERLRRRWFGSAPISAKELAGCTLGGPGREAACALRVASSYASSRELKLRALDAVRVRFTPIQDPSIAMDVNLSSQQEVSFSVPGDGATLELTCAAPSGCRWPALQ